MNGFLQLVEAMNNKVLNMRNMPKQLSNNCVYIGRPSKWGNPFVIGKDGTREEVIQKYEDYLFESDLFSDIIELCGKNLVCWCAPNLVMETFY